MCLYSLSNLSLRSKNSNTSFATSIVILIFFVLSMLFIQRKNKSRASLECGQTKNTSSRNLFQPITEGQYCGTFLSKLSMAMSVFEKDIWGAWAEPSVWGKCLLFRFHSVIGIVLACLLKRFSQLEGDRWSRKHLDYVKAN